MWFVVAKCASTNISTCIVSAFSLWGLLMGSLCFAADLSVGDANLLLLQILALPFLLPQVRRCARL